jgi:hypothetical protein
MAQLTSQLEAAEERLKADLDRQRAGWRKTAAMPTG